MATQAIVCPTCTAPNPTGPDPTGEYLCVYCGARFHRAAAAAPAPAPAPAPRTTASGPTAAPSRASSDLRAAILVGVVAVLVLGGGVAGFVLLAAKSDPPPETRDRPTPVSTTPARAPIEAPASSPSASVAAPAVAEPEPEAPATATFEHHRDQSGYQTSYYALGMITNTSPFVIDKPKVIAVLLDAEGKEVATDFGFAQRDVLGPDDRSAVKILIKDPPAHDSVRFEVVARKASWVPDQVEGLRVEPSEPRPAPYGANRWKLEGKVHNEDTRPAKFISVEIQAWGADDKLVGVGETYADIELLQPGASARYSSDFAVADAVDHFTFSVGSRAP